MKLTERNFGLPIFALIIGAFLFVGSQRLGAVPLPDSGDESMILQVPYEILNRGLIAWPMYRYLGGNIENTWHSFRPVYYLSMTDFFKVFALILSTRKNPVYIKDPDENYTLLGKMENTPYGHIRVYYTGTDPGYRTAAAVSYQFFERWRGHVRDDQIAAARPVSKAMSR